jgi:hypothetical protein
MLVSALGAAVEITSRLTLAFNSLAGAGAEAAGAAAAEGAADDEDDEDAAAGAAAAADDEDAAAGAAAVVSLSLLLEQATMNVRAITPSNSVMLPPRSKRTISLPPLRFLPIYSGHWTFD